MSKLNPISNLITKTGAVADDLVSTDEERQLQLSDRHKIDMASDNWLSKSIRPLICIALVVCQIGLVVAEVCGITVSEALIIEIGTLNSGAFGFYFYSRKAEKVAAKNAQANIEIEKIRTKAEVREARRQNRHERKLERKNGA